MIFQLPILAVRLTIESKGMHDYKSSLRTLETNIIQEIEKEGVLKFIGF